MKKEKNKTESVNEWKVLKEAMKEMDSRSSWMRNNVDLLFEELSQKECNECGGPNTNGSDMCTDCYHKNTCGGCGGPLYKGITICGVCGNVEEGEEKTNEEE